MSISTGYHLGNRYILNQGYLWGVYSWHCKRYSEYNLRGQDKTVCEFYYKQCDEITVKVET